MPRPTIAALLSERIEGFGRIGWQHSSPRNFVSFPGYLPGDTIDRFDARIGVDFEVFHDRRLRRQSDQRGWRRQLPDGAALGPGLTDISASRLRPRTFGVELTARFGRPAR